MRCKQAYLLKTPVWEDSKTKTAKHKQLKMFLNSSGDENVSVSDVHIGLETNDEPEYIEEDFSNGTYEDLSNYTAHDYCLVCSIQ